MKKSLSFLATLSLGALLTASISVANAQDPIGGPGSCEGDVLDEAALGGFLLVVETNPNANQQAVQTAVSAAAASAAPDDFHTIIVDGIVMSMAEMVIEGLIRNGTFVVVAGATTTVDLEENYPCWARTDCQ